MGGRGRNVNRFYLHWGQQGKHIVGHNNYKPWKSPITISKERLQQLFNKYRGTGIRHGDREVVNFHEVIGKIENSETGKMEETTRGTIHYRKDGGYHIIPASPKIKEE